MKRYLIAAGFFVVASMLMAQSPPILQDGYAARKTNLSNLCKTDGTNCDAGQTSSSNSWTTAIDCKFSTQATQALDGGDTTYTICGATWNKINSRNEATPMNVNNGTGLVITPVANCDFFHEVRSSPALLLQLSSVIPNFSYDTSIRVRWYLQGFNGAANFDGTVVGIESATPSTDGGMLDAGVLLHHFYYVTHIGWNTTPASANGEVIFAWWDGLTNAGNGSFCTNQYSVDAGGLSPPVWRNVFGWVNAFGLFPMGVDTTNIAGAYSSGFPAWNQIPPLCGLSWGTDTNISLDESNMNLPSGWYLIITAKRSGSATSLVSTIGEVEVDYR